MKSWKIYGCKIVEPAEGEQTVRRLPKAILIDRENSIKEAVGLPRGFTTKVLLDYDFLARDPVPHRLHGCDCPQQAFLDGGIRQSYQMYSDS